MHCQPCSVPPLHLTIKLCGLHAVARRQAPKSPEQKAAAGGAPSPPLLSWGTRHRRNYNGQVGSRQGRGGMPAFADSFHTLREPPVKVNLRLARNLEQDLAGQRCQGKLSWHVVALPPHGPVECHMPLPDPLQLVQHVAGVPASPAKQNWFMPHFMTEAGAICSVFQQDCKDRCPQLDHNRSLKGQVRWIRDQMMTAWTGRGKEREEVDEALPRSCCAGLSQCMACHGWLNSSRLCQGADHSSTAGALHVLPDSTLALRTSSCLLPNVHGRGTLRGFNCQDLCPCASRAWQCRFTLMQEVVYKHL